MAPAKVRRAPYKDFLQPALQRRFSTTATVILAIAYVESLLLANWNSWLWPWFPLGPAGIRTLFIFACGLLILVLRIAQYHVGLRTSNSALQTFLQNALTPKTLWAIVWHVVSAWLFGQIFLWSASPGAGLGWITYFNGDRARLNERAVFVTVHSLVLGLTQAIAHIGEDRDRVTLGTVKPRREGVKEFAAGDAGSHAKKFLDKLPYILLASGHVSFFTLLITTLAYFVALRSLAWNVALTVFRPFYSLPKYNILPMSWPLTLGVVIRCFILSLLLSFVWLAGNTAFSIFLVKEPIKNGKPLSSDSKDPNGSLLNGLKSKKLSIKCFAAWELAFIACDFEDRRKTIYEDIDRKDGPMWSQVYAICLELVKELEVRIDNYGKAPAPPAASADSDAAATARPSYQKPMKSDPFAQSVSGRKSAVGEVGKSVGKYVGKTATDPSQQSRLSPIGKAAGEAKQRLLEMKKQMADAEGNGDGVDNVLQTRARALLSSSFGWPLRQEFHRRIPAAAFGGPYAEPSLYINAVTALSQLAVHSLQEDKYGNVQRDVAHIVRTLTAVAQKLDSFKRTFPLHWTDVHRDRSCPEVDAVLEALRDGLSDVVLKFERYSRDLRLTMADMRLAREAIGVPVVSRTDEPAALAGRRTSPEMQQLR